MFGIVKDRFNNVAVGSDKLPYTTLGYANGPGGLLTGPRSDLTGVNTADKDFRQQALVKKSSETHGGEDVGTLIVKTLCFLIHPFLKNNLGSITLSDTFLGQS